MTTTLRVAVLGGGYAGVLAARRLARRGRGRVHVTLISEREAFVERIRLHEVAAGSTRPSRSFAVVLAGSGVEFRQARIAALDVARRSVALEGGGSVECDGALLALGSSTATNVPGVARYAHRLDSPDSARHVHEALSTSEGPLVVVGGGLTAIEAMCELQHEGSSRSATLVCRGALGEGVLSALAVAQVRAALARRGVEVLEQTPVLAVEPEGVVLSKARVPASVVVWAAGFAVSALAREAGLRVDAAGALVVDDLLRAPSSPWLFGAGDAVTVETRVGAPLHMSCKNAMPMAASAADALLAQLRGQPLRPFRFGDSGVCVSLGRRDAVIQLRGAAGENTSVLQGRLAVFVKERVSRFTLTALASPLAQGSFRAYAARGESVLRAAAALPRGAGVR